MAENFKKNYIEYLYSLSKESPSLPWQIEYPNPLDVGKKIVLYLENFYYPAGSYLNDILVISIGEDFKYILDNLFPTINKYKYFWPLEGQVIDVSGYDFYSNFDDTGNARYIEITDSARVIIWEKLNIKAPHEELEFFVTQEEYVSAKHLSKLQITFAKAGPVSEISLNLYTIKDVELLSIVYESDTTRYVVPKKINLNELTTINSSDVFTLKFGKPIFAKRLTIVIGQNNADINSYYIKDNNKNEESIYSEPKTIDEEINKNITSLIERNVNYIDFSNMEETYKEYLKNQKEIQSYNIYTTNEILDDSEIEDWSIERKNAYIKWREKAIAFKNKKEEE